MSTNLFGGEISDLYAALFKQLAGPHGPWKCMLEATLKASSGKSSPVILDIATGPGEPACMIAHKMPDASVIATDIS